MSDTRPNIIYIVCHDIGKHLGCYGADVPSPNLDRFAEGAIRFNNFFCNAPACSPSRACAMTGRYSHSTRMMGLVNKGWSLSLDERTIVDELNDAGYETAHFGLQHERSKWEHNRYQLEGFDYDEKNLFVENVVDKAIDYLESRVNADRPFYLNLGTHEVHASGWQGHGAYFDWRAADYVPDPPERVFLPPYIPDAPQIRRELGKFQGSIRKLDEHLARLFAVIERLGYRDNSIVIFTTDHGIWAMRAKGTIYDRGVEIAFLMQLPRGQGAGAVIDHLGQNIDVTPTLLDAAGAAIPERIQGRSFWPLVSGGDYHPHEQIFIERNYHGGQYDPMRAARTRDWHYIRNFDPEAKKAWLPGETPHLNETYENWWEELWPERSLPRPGEELFRVSDDPDEFIDRAADPACAAIKAELAAAVDQWMAESDDPLLNGPIPKDLSPWPDGE